LCAVHLLLHHAFALHWGGYSFAGFCLMLYIGARLTRGDCLLTGTIRVLPTVRVTGYEFKLTSTCSSVDLQSCPSEAKIGASHSVRSHLD